MVDYTKMTLDELRTLFDAKRKELVALRDEIDRRETKPVAEVNFEKYVTK